MKRNMIFAIALLFSVTAIVGCATVKQAKDDAALGLTAPLESTTDPLTGETVVEKSPQQKANEATQVISVIPYVGPFAPAIAPLLVGFFAWSRGRRIRKNMPVSANPITGAFGPKIGVGSFNLENVVQIVTDVFKGAYEVGADGSGLKRGYKTALSIILALVGGAFLVPGVKEFVVDNQNIVATVTLGSALFSAIEKKLQDVRPVALPPATPGQ